MATAHQIRTRLPHLIWDGATITWQQVRGLTADWLEQHPYLGEERFSDWLVGEDGWDGHSWDRYVSNVRDCRSVNPAWGNNVTIHAMANVLGVPFWIWCSGEGEDNSWIEVNPEGYDPTHPVPAIELGHVFESHYLSVIEHSTGAGVFLTHFGDGFARERGERASFWGGGGGRGHNAEKWEGDTKATSVHLGGKHPRNSPVSTPGNASRTQGAAKREKVRGFGIGILGEQDGAKGGAASDKSLGGGVSLEKVYCGICGNSAGKMEFQGDLWVCGSCGKDYNTWSEEGVRVVEGGAVPEVKVQVISAQKPVISGQSSQGAQERVSREPEKTRGNRREMSPAARRRRVSGTLSPVGNERGRSNARSIPVQKPAEGVSEKSGVIGGGSVEGFTAQSLPQPNEHVQCFNQGSWVQATVVSLDHSLQPPGVSVRVGPGERVVDTELERLRRSSPAVGGGQSFADTLPDFAGVFYQGGSATGFGGGFKTVPACRKFLEYLGGGGTLPPKQRCCWKILRQCGRQLLGSRRSTGLGPSAI